MQSQQISVTSGCWPVAAKVSSVSAVSALAKGLLSAIISSVLSLKHHTATSQTGSVGEMCIYVKSQIFEHFQIFFFICDHVAQRLDCGAKKLIEYDYATWIATVYHLGTHKCTPQLPKRALPVQHPHIQLGHTLRGSAKEVGLRQIVSLIDAGDMDAAEKEAEVWLDRWRVKRQMESMDPHQGMDHNSFDAVGIVKQKTDKKDPFYIYRIGNRNLGGSTDFVFKSSRKMAQMALNMDIDGESNLLQMENAYFDATHTWVYGFKSLGLWLIHPAMKKIQIHQFQHKHAYLHPKEIQVPFLFSSERTVQMCSTWWVQSGPFHCRQRQWGMHCYWCVWTLLDPTKWHYVTAPL